MSIPQVVCLPGSVAPAAQRYRPLIEAVGEAAAFHFKDLEVYSEDTPPQDYSIEMELSGVDSFADSLGLERFHMVGYSGGGFCALAYAGTRPHRLLSLALFEPARIPGELTAAEREFMDGLERKLAGLRGPEFMATFVREQVKPGAKLQPPPPPNLEMRKRPAGIAAMVKAFDAYEFDRELLRACAFPIYYAYGDLSHDEQAVKAGVLARLCQDVHVQRFAGVHHFVPPEEIYRPAHVASIRRLWRTADERSALELAL